MVSYRLRFNEMILVDLARANGNLTLSDISDTYDLELKDEFDRNKAMRKIKRLLALGILEKKSGSIIFTNKRNYPEEVFQINLSRWDQADSNSSE